MATRPAQGQAAEARARTRRGQRPLALDDLTLPDPGARSLRQVLSRQVRRWERAFPAMPVRLLAPGDRALYVASVQAWRALAETDRARAAHVLRMPTVSVLIECALRHVGPQGDHAALATWLRELSALVLLELAVLGALPEAGVTWTREAEGRAPLTLRSVSANLALPLPDEVTAVRFGPGLLALERAGGALQLALGDPAPLPAVAQSWGATRPYHVVVPGVFLALSDNNPLSDFEAHPDKEGNQLDLGDKPVSAWVESLRTCFALIDTHLPELGKELRLIARLIIPVGWDPERHLSASYQEYIGAIYLTLHPNDMTMVEAVIHEFQHNKINAAFNLDPLLRNAFSPLFTSPVRPDPRPLHGVILAVHAFQPVARLYEQMREAQHPWSKNPSWNRRFGVIVDKIRDGAATVLHNAEPTPVGARYFADMRRWDSHFASVAVAVPSESRG